MKVLVTLWFFTAVAVTLPLGWLVARAMVALGVSRDRVERFVNSFCHEYLTLWPGWKVTVRGPVPPAPCVLVANHQSMSDVLAVMGLPFSFYFVSKASLFSVPLIGSMMRLLGHVPLVRGSTESTRVMMDRCEALLRAGHRVLIFPEGTYAPVPQRLPFRRGAFALAQRLGVPVVPVVLRGTYALVPHDGPYFSPCSEVGVEVHTPVESSAFADDEMLRTEVARRFNGWLASRRGDSPGEAR